MWTNEKTIKAQQAYFMHELPSVARNSTIHMHVSLDCCNNKVMRLDHWSTSTLHSTNDIPQSHAISRSLVISHHSPFSPNSSHTVYAKLFLERLRASPCKPTQTRPCQISRLWMWNQQTMNHTAYRSPLTKSESSQHSLHKMEETAHNWLG